MEWEDLASLSFEVSGQAVQLDDGRATITYGGESADRYTLQNRVVQGDLDGDGYDDLIAHIVLTTAGTGVFHLVAPVIDDGQGGTALQPVWVGDRVVVESIEVRDGVVEVFLLDRGPDEPFTVISRGQTLEIDFFAPEPTVSVIDSQPLENLPLVGPEQPEIAIRFDPGAVGAIVAGTIDYRQRQAYTAHMAAGQPFTATLDAPIGVWLDVRLDDHLVASASQRSQQVRAELPASGTWRITVVSVHAGEADYRLSIEALPLGSDSAPATIPTVAPVEAGLPDFNLTLDGPAPVMYFTFDDGPHAVHTLEVLEVLARYDARATFFVIGSVAQHFPNTIQRILNEGHTIGNHTWNHDSLAGLPREEFDETVSRTQEMLGERGSACLRPPYKAIDAFTANWAAEHGLSLALWNIDPEDWRRPSALTIARYIVDRAYDGAIVLLHDGGDDRSQTVLALDVALSHLSKQGYRFEPLCT